MISLQINVYAAPKSPSIVDCDSWTLFPGELTAWYLTDTCCHVTIRNHLHMSTIYTAHIIRIMPPRHATHLPPNPYVLLLFLMSCFMNILSSVLCNKKTYATRKRPFGSSGKLKFSLHKHGLQSMECAHRAATYTIIIDNITSNIKCLATYIYNPINLPI